MAAVKKQEAEKAKENEPVLGVVALDPWLAPFAGALRKRCVL